jgi:hypothetical protein
MTARRPLNPLIYAVVALCAVIAGQQARGNDLDTARARYEECYKLLEENKPCKALAACKEGLKAKDLSTLKTLTSKANQACEQEKKTRVPVCAKGQKLVDSKHCCWEGQIWGLPAGSEEEMCLGKPTSCPPGLIADAFFQTCRRETCEGDYKIFTAEGKCCWPGQSWNAELGLCWGYPRCPEYHAAAPVEQSAASGVSYETFMCMMTDRDEDGVNDKDDECPDDPEDFDLNEVVDGCPDPDNDNDGICDPDLPEKGASARYCRGVDQCKDNAEDKDGFQDDDGCPDPDNDGDGVPDLLDRCPGTDRDVLQGVNTLEDMDGYEDDDGCPDVSPAELAALRPQRNHTWQIIGWSAVGLGVGMVGTGIGLEVWANSMRNEVLEPTASTGPVIESVKQVDVPDLESKANAVGTVGTVLWASGAALMASGAALVLYDLIKQPTYAPEVESDTPRLSGQVGTDYWMMTLSGRF